MYIVTYHHKIPKDLEQISATQRKTIKPAIGEKLAADPMFFGKPLQYSLKGLRSMRVGNYRVVFQLLGQEIFIVLIEHRSKVYRQADQRMK